MALIVHEGNNTLLAGSSDGAAVAAPSLGRTGHGTLRRGDQIPDHLIAWQSGQETGAWRGTYP